MVSLHMKLQQFQRQLQELKMKLHSEDDDSLGVKQGDPIYQGIDQSKLVPLLVAALQEAIGRIEALEAK